jgi:hypothetical protein
MMMTNLERGDKALIQTKSTQKQRTYISADDFDRVDSDSTIDNEEYLKHLNKETNKEMHDNKET